MSLVIPDLSGLNFAPREVEAINQAIFEKVFNNGLLNDMHMVWQGVDMQQQIVFAGQYDRLGVAGSATCGTNSSDPELPFSQKYTQPLPVEDKLEICTREWPALWKMFQRSSYLRDTELNIDQGAFNVIMETAPARDLDNDAITSLYLFFVWRLSQGLTDSVFRLAWHGDPDLVVAGAASAGAASAAFIPAYDSVSGIWKKIFAEGTDIKGADITENAEALVVDQLAITPQAAYDYIKAVVDSADARLIDDPNAFIGVSYQIFNGYRDYLKEVVGINSGDLSNFKNSIEDPRFADLPTLMFNDIPVVNMRTIWDRYLITPRTGQTIPDFYGNTTDNNLWLPNRIVMTTPENIPVTTLNEDDFSMMKVWYNEEDEKNKQKFAYTLEGMLLENYMIRVAY